MKVTTIACIQGAWMPFDLKPDKILDIGAGTGLLSLMVAQRYPLAQLDAIEIDREAFIQLSENVEKSPWTSRIQTHCGDIKIYYKNLHKAYDLVICNPPFYTKCLKSPDRRISLARHNDSLPVNKLIQICSQILTENGFASILLPPVEMKQAHLATRDYGLNIAGQLIIRQQAGKSLLAVVNLLSKIAVQPIIEELDTHNPTNGYTERFRQLMRPYYLDL